MIIDLAQWDRTQNITIMVKGVLSFCVTRLQTGIVKADMVVTDDSGRELLRTNIITKQFTVSRPTGVSREPCREFEFDQQLVIKNQIPTNINSINVDVITNPVFGSVEDFSTELEIFEADVPEITTLIEEILESQNGIKIKQNGIDLKQIAIIGAVILLLS